MKAELNIDHKEFAKEITQEVIKALKPLLNGREENDKALFTVKGLAEYLQVSDKWVYERVQFKEIPHYKIGGNLRFKRSAIDLWMDTLKTPAVSPLSSPLKVLK
jgi:excisionase family DNA binding protein